MVSVLQRSQNRRVLHQQKQKQPRQPLVLVLMLHLMSSLIFFLMGVSVSSAFTITSTITSSLAPSTIRTAWRTAISISSRERSEIITTTTSTTTTRNVNNQHDNRLISLLFSSSQDNVADNTSKTIIDTTNSQVTKQESSTNSDPTTSSVGFPHFHYTIRDCTYTELKQVATLTVNGFYDTTKMNKMSQKLTELAELNRLQQTYSYEYDKNEQHRMLIVVATPITRIENLPTAPTKELIVGYLDVDVRPCELKVKLPRPYISDVVVDIKHRRQGLARKLVEEGEHFIVKTTQQKKKEKNNPDLFSTTYTDVWIRVEETNIAAIALYQNQLGYVNMDWCTSTGSYSEITRNNTIDTDTNNAEDDTVVRTNVTSDKNDVSSTFMNTVVKSISTFKGKETPNILTLRKRIESNGIE